MPIQREQGKETIFLIPFPQKEIGGVVHVKVTKSERREFRDNMRMYRGLSAAYSTLLKEKGVKNPAERQAALGQAKLHYELKADELFFKYKDSAVLKSVENFDWKVSSLGMLTGLVSIWLGAYLFMKGFPANQKLNIKEFMDFFKRNAVESISSILLPLTGATILFLTVPLEGFFSGKPMQTFSDIKNHIERRKFESEPDKP